MEHEENKTMDLVVFDVLSTRQKDLCVSTTLMHHSGSDDSPLCTTERDHVECRSVVACNNSPVNLRHNERVIILSWEADSSW